MASQKQCVCLFGWHRTDFVYEGSYSKRTWSDLVSRFGCLRVVVLSQNRRFAVQRNEKMIVFFCPDVSRAMFIGFCVVIGLATRLRRGRVMNVASEPWTSGIGAVLLKLVAGVPFVAEIQGEIFRENVLDRRTAAPLARALATISTTFADGIRIVNLQSFEELKPRHLRGRVFLVPPRCDLSAFNPKKYDQVLTRLRFGNGDGALFVICYVGRISPEKGLIHLLRAYKHVAIEYPQSRLWIAGNGPDEEAMRAEAVRLSLGRNVRFLGWIPHGLLPDLLAAVDVVVIPSLSEGLPRVLIEALAMSKPVIASAVGGIKEVLFNGSNGFLVRPGSEMDLQDALSRVIRNPAALAPLAENARVSAQRFGWDAGMRMWGNMIEELWRR